MMRQQSLRDAMIIRFQPWERRESFHYRPKQGLHDLRQARTCHLTPGWKKEFIRISKRLVIEGIFHQMVYSEHDTSSFGQLKTYLVATHGSQMTNFELRIYNGELTDVTGWLKNHQRGRRPHKGQIQERQHFRNVFSLINIVPMSEKSLYSGCSLTSNGTSTVVSRQTTHPVTTLSHYYAHKPQRSDQTKKLRAAQGSRYKEQAGSWPTRRRKQKPPHRTPQKMTLEIGKLIYSVTLI